MGSWLIEFISNIVNITGNAIADTVIFVVIEFISGSIAFGLIGRAADSIGKYNSKIMSGGYWIINVLIFIFLTFILVKIAQLIRWLLSPPIFYYVFGLVVIILIVVLLTMLLKKRRQNINTPILKTERLILRKFTLDDLNALFEILNDEKTNEYLPWIKIENIEEAEIFLKERFLDYYNLENAFRYAVCLKEDNIPIGYVWLSNDSSHDLGYVLRSDYWNKGIISEATLKIVELLSKTNIGYITATHDINNPASGKIMEKIGMTYEYSYVEHWLPKEKEVTFRMYQLNFKKDDVFNYEEYKEKHPNNFIENI